MAIGQKCSFCKEGIIIRPEKLTNHLNINQPIRWTPASKIDHETPEGRTEFYNQIHYDDTRLDDDHMKMMMRCVMYKKDKCDAIEDHNRICWMLYKVDIIILIHDH
ncbi:hypothetical protein DICVIV_07161 [Dictyocaulus viviparus]|uniref:Uncharacterized protein n=1 Tax=Dictyocaulus viviparus TaxID=29172 RepID=A0A0D8XWR3_DICVI|nr:hypothetical protein DICVIV_07161 [Dictyocaulus viviparus]